MADVVCRSCGYSFHETTDKFRLNVMPTGDMFRLKPGCVANGWSSFPEHSGITDGGLECPGCGAPYLLSGRVMLVGGNCAICGGGLGDSGAGSCFCSIHSAVDTLELLGVDAQIKTLHAEGKTNGEIGKVLGIHHTKVKARLKAMLA